MLDWVLLFIAFSLYFAREVRFKAILFVLCANFLAHKIAFIVGIQITSALEYQYIYLAFSIIQLTTIIALINLKSHLAILIILLIQLGYNMLTVSQYVLSTYDFYSSYAIFMQTLMVLELIYMGMLTSYARNLRGICGTNNSNLFICLRRRCNHRGLF